MRTTVPEPPAGTSTRAYGTPGTDPRYRTLAGGTGYAARGGRVPAGHADIDAQAHERGAQDGSRNHGQFVQMAAIAVASSLLCDPSHTTDGIECSRPPTA